MPFQPSSTSIHEQFHLYTATEDAARTFLFSTGILRSQMSCSCLTPMDIVTCTASKSEDLKIWRCTSCRKFRNIRSDSVLARSNLSFKQFLTLMYYFSSKSLTNVEIAGFTALSEKAVGHWRHVLSNVIASWFLQNCQPIGGPGVIVEIDEAKFGKRKYNKGAYREGMWVLGGVDRNTGNCFLVPCPGNRRTAAVLLPIIERWVLPGTIIYSDEWSSYNDLTALGYTHGVVNHSIQFVDPTTGPQATLYTVGDER
jgi:hypothetical protein